MTTAETNAITELNSIAIAIGSSEGSNTLDTYCTNYANATTTAQKETALDGMISIYVNHLTTNFYNQLVVLIDAVNAIINPDRPYPPRPTH